ncbi:hypothetical protein [Halarcobacter sp.]|uniref:hypothetical protein n=1 Tax=Halarcobacter sp. TaxID=2321133 RepID=UPI002AA766DC|nr:hypothetical protein [Halarcobacter sp.]
MKDLELKLKLNDDSQKKMINWFSRQSEEIKLKIFEEKRNYFFKLKQDVNEKNEILDYMSFILAVKDIHDKLDYLNKKNKSKSLNEIAHITALELKSLKKAPRKEKYDAIVDRFSIIQKLREKSFSWRDISLIFKTKYRQNVSHQYIKNVYEELKNGL